MWNKVGTNGTKLEQMEQSFQNVQIINYPYNNTYVDKKFSIQGLKFNEETKKSTLNLQLL